VVKILVPVLQCCCALAVIAFGFCVGLVKIARHDAMTFVWSLPTCGCNLRGVVGRLSRSRLANLGLAVPSVFRSGLYWSALGAWLIPNMLEADRVHGIRGAWIDMEA
jgi:hypothetical protein